MRVVVDNYIVNKTVYDKLASKISTVDTRRFVLKTQYNTAESGLAKKIVDTNKEYLTLVDLFKKKTDSNAKITVMKSKFLGYLLMLL